MVAQGFCYSGEAKLKGSQIWDQTEQLSWDVSQNKKYKEVGIPKCLWVETQYCRQTNLPLKIWCAEFKYESSKLASPLRTLLLLRQAPYFWKHSLNLDLLFCQSRCSCWPLLSLLFDSSVTVFGVRIEIFFLALTVISSKQVILLLWVSICSSLQLD